MAKPQGWATRGALKLHAPQWSGKTAVRSGAPDERPLADTECSRNPSGKCIGATVGPVVDTAYWLAHCEGYRVDSPEGRIGLVEEVRRDDGGKRAESLAVLAGMCGLRRLIIPVSEIEAIAPHAQRLFLKPSARIVGSARRGRDLLTSTATGMELASR